MDGILKIPIDQKRQMLIETIKVCKIWKEKVKFEYDNIGEKLIQPADSGGCVEIWLDQIQNAMRKTMAYKCTLLQKAVVLCSTRRVQSISHTGRQNMFGTY